MVSENGQKFSSGKKYEQNKTDFSSFLRVEGGLVGIVALWLLCDWSWVGENIFIK